VDFGVTKYDPETGCWPLDAVNEDGTVKAEAILSYLKDSVNIEVSNERVSQDRNTVRAR
jgi:hypothetical protein